MLGSHNTMSYLKPRNLLGKITRIWNKCQEVPIMNQYLNGARYFDIRVRRINNKWYLVHNRVVYDELDKYWEDIRQVSVRAKNEGIKVYMRLILDERKKPKDADMLTSVFRALIMDVKELMFFNLKAITYWNWKTEYIDMIIQTVEYHASVSAKWYQYLLGCRHFAFYHNDDGIAEYLHYYDSRYKVLFMDYINIKI